ncbi:PREDICTED: putative protein TPRXL [Ipomoea nil]|uniref:putative protein TPRXL n=1 Tax=Ipomoea nil TaxID=35883 RepID=UPI000901DC7E|nr:PREDICTED: putative protein TPRXL [Ipomoea nil]
MSSSSDSSSSRRSAGTPASTSSSSSSSSSPRRMEIPSGFPSASPSQPTPFSSEAVTPLSSAPLTTVAALPDGAGRPRGKSDSIVRPEGRPSQISAADLEMARFLFGPSALVFAPKNRHIYDPPEGCVGIHLHSVAFGFRVPLCPFLSLFYRHYNLVSG